MRVNHPFSALLDSSRADLVLGGGGSHIHTVAGRMCPPPRLKRHRLRNHQSQSTLLCKDPSCAMWAHTARRLGLADSAEWRVRAQFALWALRARPGNLRAQLALARSFAAPYSLSSPPRVGAASCRWHPGHEPRATCPANLSALELDRGSTEHCASGHWACGDAHSPMNRPGCVCVCVCVCVHVYTYICIYTHTYMARAPCFSAGLIAREHAARFVRGCCRGPGTWRAGA
jgi:hypothetical protein